jgi:hypothetical protein
MKTTGNTLNDYLWDAQSAADQSHSLWRVVNTEIAVILEKAVCHRHSKKRVCSRLMNMAGRRTPGEPVAIENYRSAARQIAIKARGLRLI